MLLIRASDVPPRFLEQSDGSGRLVCRDFCLSVTTAEFTLPAAFNLPAFFVLG